MPRLLFATAAVCVLAACPTPARASRYYPRHEVWLGIGGAVSLEEDVFNVPDDIESNPEAAFSMGYLHNLDAHRAIGIHLYGAGETTPTVTLVDATGVARPATFDLATVNVGLRGRYMFLGEALRPYVFGGFNWVNGSATSRTIGDFIVDAATIGELSYNGVSACVGAGLAITLGHRVRMSAEGIGSFGVAKWRQKPFVNSSSADFNPSIAGGTVNVSYLWGWSR